MPDLNSNRVEDIVAEEVEVEEADTQPQAAEEEEEDIASAAAREDMLEAAHHNQVVDKQGTCKSR